MEKSKCGSSSQERWQANIKKLQTTIVTSYCKIFERLLYDRIFEFFIIWYPKINQVLDQVILVLINFSLSLMKFINPLMIILKSELYF